MNTEQMRELQNFSDRFVSLTIKDLKQYCTENKIRKSIKGEIYVTKTVLLKNIFCHTFSRDLNSLTTVEKLVINKIADFPYNKKSHLVIFDDTFLISFFFA